MELIVGGAFQGQLEYARALHPEIVWTDGKTYDPDSTKAVQGIYDFHEYIKRVLKEKGSVEKLAEDWIQQHPDAVIVSSEVGYGVVPVDKFERAYREAVGRVSTKLAAYSRRVHRVVCGIGTVIKDD